ncbi:RiPP maturation radical SAM C-methyltransferase [Desulfarculus baarsii]
MERRGGLDFCLVNMPFCRPTGPTLAPGLLQAIVRRDGLSCRVIYANVDFFRLVTYSEDVWVNSCSREQALPDWVFAGAAFPDHAPDHDEYLEQVRQRNAIYMRMSLARFREKAWSLRRRAEEFVEYTARRVVATNPRVVGCSSTFTQHVASLALLRRIRELAPAVVTVIGGANCEAAMGLATHRCFPWVDYVVSGEADELISDLVRGMVAHGRDLPPQEQPEGVLTPGHRLSGYPPLEDGGPRAMTADLGALPVPDFADYFSELKRVPALEAALSPGLLVESSRGCWWGQCRFCSLDGRKCGFRSKPPRKLLDELDSLHQTYGVDRFLFTDSLMDRRYFTEFMPELARRPKPYRLFIEIKSNLTRPELAALAKAGFTYLQPGIESFHTEHLKLMNKGVKAWQNVHVVKQCRQLGICCVYNLLYDLPGEQDQWLEEMARLAPLLAHLRPPGTVCRIRLDRLSYYVTNAAEVGLQIIPPRIVEAIFPVGEADLADLVYSFTDKDRETIDASPFLAGIFQRQAAIELMRQVALWRRAYFSAKNPAMLSMRPDGDGLLLHDSRPMAQLAARRIDGPEMALLLACNDAPRQERLRQEMLGAGMAADRWGQALEALLDWGLVAALDDRLVGLVLEEPAPPEAPWEEFGGGSLDMDLLARLTKPQLESA